MAADQATVALPYRLLGRSGLRVSRLALGTMTFGEKAWGCDRATAHAILDRFVAAGGNLVDTADYYSHGESERIVGSFAAERGLRDQLVIASKFSLGSGGNGANATGNGRKSMLAAVDGSLRRLSTDYLDLYIMHLWDGITPVEEVMRGLDDLVTSGKVRYVALSDVTGWYAARAQTLAEWRGYERLCALQLEYSLIERGLELEFPSLCEELGMGILAWAPLCNGLLSGKHRPSAEGGLATGRIETVSKAGRFDRLTERNWAIVAKLEEVAGRLGRSMAQVAINWVASRRGVGSVLLGATKVAQIDDTLQSLDFAIPADDLAVLDAVSALPRIFPYRFLDAAQPRVRPLLS
ncbi:MAG: aldo/keto reductase [Sphingobium sp.]|nr:aldo/keto reductase [Sphingobium sp.]